MASREERLAENEIVVREVNERIVDLSGNWGGSLELMCECADLKCTVLVSMTLPEYESLRSDPHQFAVLPGHERRDIEDVVERNDAFFVVHKHEETQDQAEAADPRS